MRAQATLLAISCTAPLVMAGSAATAAATTHPAPSVRHANLDGDGSPDRIVIKPAPDLVVHQGFGTGHYTVHARLSSTGGTARKRLSTSGTTSHRGRRWTPWFGTTNLNHVGGNEILLGAGSGASSISLHALAYSGGGLRTIPAPGPGSTWNVYSIATTTGGYKCTSSGVETRSYYNHNPVFHKFTIKRAFYVWHHHHWRRTHHSTTTVHGTHPPPSTRHFGEFVCHGLRRGI